jgi:hypothetical protein
MECLHRHGLFGARTVTGGIKGGSREIPYLARRAKFHKEVGQIYTDCARRPPNPWEDARQATSSSLYPWFWLFQPARIPTATAHIATFPISAPACWATKLRWNPSAYSRAQRNITFSEHAASSTSINATCSRSPANLRIGLMI